MSIPAPLVAGNRTRRSDPLDDAAALSPDGSRISTARMWTGRALSGLVVVFLVFDGVIKVLELPVVGETMQQLGYPPGIAFGLGLLTLLIAALYA